MKKNQLTTFPLSQIYAPVVGRMVGILLSALGPATLRAIAQEGAQPHAGHAMPMAPAAAGASKSGMDMALFAGMPAGRESSGTAWQPDVTPMMGHHAMLGGDWMLMTHYNVFIAYDEQSGRRGDAQLTSTNWLMLMADRQDADNKLSLRGMFSLEPWTTTKRGYPLLFQTGEAYHGRPLIDRQHPHDFFMEVSGTYRRALAADAAAFIYVAPAGEPALGPTAFPHRASAMVNPVAPISHHWLDSSHISFGVVTLGAAKGPWQLEGSAFNGREPDEDRWDIERPTIDSYAGRLSFNPGANWSLQVSQGYMASPEELHPGEALHRTTFSAQHRRELAGGGQLATTFAWGVNRAGGDSTDAYLIESAWETGKRLTLFGRAERVQKTGEELGLSPRAEKFAIRQLSVGGSYDLMPHGKVAVALGGLCSYSFKPGQLDAVYGKRPVGAWVFVRISPARKR